jgi:hypothetical protein
MNVKISCDDGDDCTIDRCHCDEGCQHFPVDPRDNADCTDWTKPKCYSDDDCDDKNACTDDSCVKEGCKNVAVSCDDKNECTMDTCEADIGCQHIDIPCYRGGNESEETVDKLTLEDEEKEEETKGSYSVKTAQATNLNVGAIVGIVVAGIAIIGAASVFIGYKLKNRVPSPPDSYNSM